MATKLIVTPIQTIQVDSFRLLNKTTHVKINEGTELIQENCSLLVSSAVKQNLAECLSNYNVNTDPEITKKNLAAKEHACLEKINNLPVGERIKICDDFSVALHLNNNKPKSGVTSFVVIANDGSSTHDLNYTAILERLNNRSMSVDDILRENFLRHRVIENETCSSLGRKNNPFAEGKPLSNLIHRACFDSSLRSDIQEYTTDYNDNSCADSIRELTEPDKELLCGKTEQAFKHFKFRNFFNKGIQRIQRICNVKSNKEIDEDT